MMDVKERAAKIYLQENHITHTTKMLNDEGYRKESGSKYTTNEVRELILASNNKEAADQFKRNRKKVSKFAW